MANEITVNNNLAYQNPAKGIQPVNLGSNGQQLFSIIGKNFAQGTLTTPTTAGGTLIPISNLSSLGWASFKNTDPTNYVDILTGVGGVDIVRMYPGEPAQFRFGSGITAPAALANTSPVLLEYLILEA